MLNRGIFRMEEYVEGGWLSALKYEDEVLRDLERRTDSKPDKLKAVRHTRTLPVMTVKNSSQQGSSARRRWRKGGDVRETVRGTCAGVGNDPLPRLEVGT